MCDSTFLELSKDYLELVLPVVLEPLAKASPRVGP
jgi:hypothetical protein